MCTKYSCRLALLVYAMLGVALDSKAAEWDAAAWPASVQQSFAEALVWNIAAYSLDDDEEERSDQKSNAALDNALKVAKAESSQLYAEVLTAAVECSLGDGGSLSDLRESALAMLDAVTEEATLETAQQVIPPDVTPEVQGLLKAMQKDAAKKRESAENAAIESLATLLGGLTDQDVAWCVEAVRADPNCLSAWMILSRVGDDEVRLYAAKQWVARDPDNGVPLMVLAESELRQITGLVSDGPLKRLEEAEKKPTVGWPEFRGPAAFNLTYPDAKRFRELGVVGKRVVPAALLQLSDFGLTTSNIVTFRPLTRAYCDAELADYTLKQFNPALRSRAVPVLSRLAARMMDESVDAVIDFLTASAVVSSVFDLRSRSGDPPKRTPAEAAYLEAIKTYVRRFKSAGKELARLVGEDGSENDLERLICEGKYDKHASERDSLAAIRETVSFTELVEAILAERGYAVGQND